MQRVFARRFLSAPSNTAAAAAAQRAFTAQELGEMALGGELPQEKLAEKHRYTELPKLADALVRVTLVDTRGKRFNLVGREGDTLVGAASSAGVTLLDDDSIGGGNPHEVIRNSRYSEKLFGEGAVSWFSHVIVPNEWAQKMPTALWAEQEMLQWIPKRDRSPNSRLATEIKLTKALDGLVVVVPDRPPQSQEHYSRPYTV